MQLKHAYKKIAYKYPNIYTYSICNSSSQKSQQFSSFMYNIPFKYCPFFFPPNVAFDISSSTVGAGGNGSEATLASLSLLSGSPRCHPCYDERQVANCYLVVSRRVYITRFHSFHMYMKYMNMSIFPPGCLKKNRNKFMKS